jgi:hypothetical protein
MKRFLLRVLAGLRGRLWGRGCDIFAGGIVKYYTDVFGRVWRKEAQWDENGFTTMVMKSRHVEGRQ